MPKQRKTPQEKKRLSLTKDRRNTYGANDKASRKRIPLSKASAHREVRRKATVSTHVWERLDEVAAQSTELTLRTPSLQKPKFRKSPDKPLGTVLEKQTTKRARLKGRKKRVQAAVRAARQKFKGKPTLIMVLSSYSDVGEPTVSAIVQ